jgi:hypothetical protein
MDPVDLLNAAASAGGVGLAVFMLVVIYLLGRKTLALVEDKVLPLVNNHLKHIEQSFDSAAAGYDRMASSIDDLRRTFEDHFRDY